MEEAAEVTEVPAAGSIRRMPGPRGHWAFANGPALKRDVFSFLTSVVRDHGRACRIRVLPAWHEHLFAHPEHYRQILVKNHAAYDKVTVEFMLLRALLGESVVTTTGAKWRGRRQIAMPTFNHNQVGGFCQIMVSSAERLIERWQTRGAADDIVDVEAEMSSTTLDVVCRALLGLELGEHAENAGRCFTQINGCVRNMFERPWLIPMMLLPRPLNSRFTRGIELLQSLMLPMIRDRRDNPAAFSDLLSALVQGQDADSGEPLTDAQIFEELITYLLAGHETSASSLSWAWYLLSRHADVEANLHAELDRVLGGRAATASDLSKLTYTRMVVDETLRLYPPGYLLSRRAIQSDVVDGFQIREGTTMFLAPYVTHRDPEFWPDPERFQPERFAPEVARAQHLFAYVPYGFGPRRCIGADFANTEMVLILATVAQRYRLKAMPGLRIELLPRASIRNRGGMPMRLEPRV
jgi:cytochrome P450